MLSVSEFRVDRQYTIYAHKLCNLKLSNALKVRLNAALKYNLKTGSADRDLGCSVEELKQYLEFKFQSLWEKDNLSKGDS